MSCLKNKTLLFLFVFCLVFIFSVSVFAQNFGCCCNPVTFSGSIETKASCDAKKYVFADLPSFGYSCDDICEAKFLLPRVPVCGDGICEGDEFITCPSDCVVPGPEAIECGSPDFSPAPVDFVVVPVKGEKKFRLSFTQVCPADYVQVLRSEDGKTFEYIAQIKGNVFVDDDPELRWDKEYTYNIFSVYVFSGRSSELSLKARLGDIECWNNNVPVFCLSPNFYYKFEDYLKTFGYDRVLKGSFDLDFESAVNSVFSNRFNKAFYCSDINKLVISRSCSDNQFCGIKNDVPVCINKGVCDNKGIFGLFSTIDSCENSSGTPEYCFFDRSFTIIDSCYDCLPGMVCYDYKSEDSCLRDNCGVGSCDWHYSDVSLGIGVCVDSRQSNCLFCDERGSVNAPNLDAFNEVFDGCNEKKTDALSVFGFSCFYHRDYRKAVTCDEVSCFDYTEAQCNSPSQGIRLNKDNSLLSFSGDVCDIRVCQFDSVNRKCRKNADGSLSGDWADCELGDLSCERDLFPPITSVIPSGNRQVDFLNIIIMDKLNFSDNLKNHAGEDGYETFLCLRSGSELCDDARIFPFSVSSDKLILKNLVLKDGQRKIADLKKGSNNLFFYSRDKNNNVEIIKNISFSACDNCQGPTLLEARISSGKAFGSVLYSGVVNPVVTLVFDEPTKIVSSSVSGSSAKVNFGANFAYEHSLSFSQALGEGNFRLYVQAKNEKEILIPDNGLMFSIVIDTSLADVTVIPMDGSVFKSGNVNFDLGFDNFVVLKKAVLTHVVSENKFFLNRSSRDILSLFSNVDNERFFANLTGLRPGAYSFYFEAENRNGFPIAREVRFFVEGVDFFINLISPKFGVSHTHVFFAEFETSLKYDECRYAFNLPAIPSINSNTFRNYPLAFRINNYVFNTAQLSIPYGDRGKKSLYVFCKKGNSFDDESFDVYVDSGPPVILEAYAFPDVIAEEFLYMDGKYVTSIRVETDKDSFCRFSSSKSQFDLMENEFSGFDVFPKKSHSVSVMVDEIKSYRYYVACKSPAGIISTTKTVDFSVDLNAPFKVRLVTDSVSNNLSFNLGVEVNKLSLCYFGEGLFSINTLFGLGELDYVHRQEIRVGDEGLYDYFIRCSIPRTGEESDIIKASVIVDTTPPVMLWVNDSSLLKDPEVSYFSDMLGLSFLGNDSGSFVSRYLISVREIESGMTIKNRSVSRVLDGSYTYVKNLTLKNYFDYEVIVEAVDRAGWVSLPMSGDGVFINFSSKPDFCSNGVLDGNETDIDCGGPCEPCGVGKICQINADCVSDLCLDNVCKESNFSCSNGIKDGDETDIDCGGSCEPCELGEGCYDNFDCQSGYCDISSGVCKVVPSCKDGKLSSGETDIDCGGPCEPCGEGKNCEVDFDCASGLFCNNGVCSFESERVSVEDVDEILFETEPFESDYPEKKSGILIFFIILLILAGGGLGGYLLYKKFKEDESSSKIPGLKHKKIPDVSFKGFPEKKKVERDDFVKKKEFLQRDFLKEAPVKKDKFSKLRTFAKEKTVEDDEWVELSSKKKVDDAFEQLKNRFGVGKKDFKADNKKGSLDSLKKKFNISSSDSSVFDKLKKTAGEKKKNRRK
jgi:hypothetical protein